MAGDRSDGNARGATADQPPTGGEPTYQPADDRGGDVAGSEHEEPIDGPEPDPDQGPEATAARGGR